MNTTQIIDANKLDSYSNKSLELSNVIAHIRDLKQKNRELKDKIDANKLYIDKLIIEADAIEGQLAIIKA